MRTSLDAVRNRYPVRKPVNLMCVRPRVFWSARYSARPSSLSPGRGRYNSCSEAVSAWLASKAAAMLVTSLRR